MAVFFSFVLELYPDLKPKWLFDISGNEADRLWVQRYKDIASQSDVNYGKNMFGDENDGIPWCAVYAIGFRLVQRYLKRHEKSAFP